MSKRDRTTATPKKRRKVVASSDQGNSQGSSGSILGNYMSRGNRDDQLQKLLVRGTIAILGIIAVLLVAVFVINQFITPNQVVATVNGQDISVGEFQDRIRFERENLTLQLTSEIARLETLGVSQQQVLQFEPYSTWYNELQFSDALGRRVANDMVDDVLIEEAAAEMGISVGEDLVESEINAYFAYDPTAVALIGVDPTETPIPSETPTPFITPTPAPTNTPTPAAESTEEATAESTIPPAPTLVPSPTSSQEEIIELFNENVENFRSRVGGDAADAFFQREALRRAIAVDLVGDVDTVPYVNSRHILVATESEAEDVLTALENGESFAEIARAISTDSGSAVQGGELGWSAVTSYLPEFALAVADLPIGEISEPVQTEAGYHIIQVLEREEREATSDELTTLQDQQFDAWLEELRAANEANIEISDAVFDFVP